MRLIVLMVLLPTLVFAQGLTVEEAVKLAISRNPRIKESMELLKAQMFREKRAFSRLLPTLNFGYTYTRLKERPYARFTGVPGFPPYKSPIGKRRDVEWKLEVTWPIFTGFYLETLHRMEKLGVKVKEFQKRFVEISLAHAVREAYYGVLVAQRNLETAQESVRQLEAHLRDAESFYRNGLVPYNHVLKAKVALAEAIEERERAREALNTAWVNLNLLIKEDPFSRHRLKTTLSQDLGKKPLSLKELYELALSRRPDVKALEVAVEKAKLGVKAAKSRYYPWITVFGGYEQKGENLLASKNTYTNRENAYVGFRIEMPIFDPTRKYEVGEAKRLYFSMREELDSLKDQVRLEVQRAYAMVKVARRNIETARDAVDHAKEDLRITRLQYSQQLASSSDVIDSEKAYIEARNNYYNSLFQYHVALSELAMSCGLLKVEGVLR